MKSVNKWLTYVTQYVAHMNYSFGISFSERNREMIEAVNTVLDFQNKGIEKDFG